MAEATKKMQIVFASAECAPFVKTGGLGDVAGSLPAALVKAGAEVIVMVPKYATIKDEYKSQMTHLTDFYVSLGWRNEYCGLEKLERDGVTYIFIDNERYFARDYPYGFFDDGERFAFFSKAITESLQHLPEGFECDILHCNDWQTALAPVFLREFYQGLPLYDRVKTIFSIHNVAFQGQFSDKVMEDILGLAHIPAAATQLRCDRDSINYMLGALHYADAITTVSPTYAGEIQTPEFGEGLDGVLRERSYALQGILNGIDMDAWNPATDTRIAATYSAADMAGKAVCKAKLQEELGLEVRDDRPLMVMVTRLTRQKGLDLVMYSLDRILSGGVQVAVLGTGDRDYEDSLRYFESKYPGTMAARIEFDAALSQRMYAGADLFLMPSLFEPCGLSQIIAMRYGTLPIVRETGGLKDTVIPYNQFTGEGTGFSFSHFNGDEMGDAVFRAARLYWDDRAAFDQLVKQAMTQDFSWAASADKYLDLYFFMHPEIERPAATETEAKAEPAGEKPVKPAATAKKPAAKKAPAKKATTTRKRATATKKAAAAKVEADAADATVKAPETAGTKAAEPMKQALDLKDEAPAEKAAEVKTETETAAAKPSAKKAAAKSTTAKTASKATVAKRTTAKKTAATKAADKTEVKPKATEASETPAAKTATAKAKPAAKTTTKAAAKPVAKATATKKPAAAKKTATKAVAETADEPATEKKPAAKKATAAKTAKAPATKAKVKAEIKTEVEAEPSKATPAKPEAKPAAKATPKTSAKTKDEPKSAAKAAAETAPESPAAAKVPAEAVPEPKPATKEKPEPKPAKAKPATSVKSVRKATASRKRR